MPKKRGSPKSGSNAQKNRARSKQQSARVKSTKPKKKTWAERWGESPVDYEMGDEEMRKLLKKVRNLTARRMASLEKGNSFSYAAMQFDQAMKKTYLGGKLPDVNKMKWQAVERELRSHHQFWSSKTSTTSGARAEQVEQSKRIWGVDKSGKPARLMTFEESKAFWSAYEEFNNIYKGSIARYDSNRIQQAVGQVFSNVGFWITDLKALSEAAMEHLKLQSEMAEKLGTDFEDFDPNNPNKAFDPMKLKDTVDESGNIIQGIRLKFRGI